MGSRDGEPRCRTGRRWLWRDRPGSSPQIFSIDAWKNRGGVSMSDRVGLGDLALCMGDSDASARARAVRLRQKAVGLSVVLEAAVLSGLILWPLATLEVLQPQQMVTPLPPFRGAPAPRPVSRVATQTIADAVRQVRTALYQPPRIPPRIEAGRDPEPPGFDAAHAPSPPGIVDGFLDGQPIELARPVQPRPERILLRSGRVMAALLIHRVDPEYPPLAQTIRLSGTVVLRARIGTDGEVRDLEVVSGNALLAQSALEAVRQWRYRPTMLEGEAVEVETQVTVNFVLH
jgi:periplasmic protein TonB